MAAAHPQLGWVSDAASTDIMIRRSVAMLTELRACGSWLQPFAFMRLTHEVVRSLMGTMDSFAKKAAAGDDVDGSLAELATAFKEIVAVISVHMQQENEVFFPTLDKLFDGVATKAGFFEEHSRDSATFDTLASLFADHCAKAKEDVAGVAQLVSEFVVDHEAHLKGEEDGE